MTNFNNYDLHGMKTEYFTIEDERELPQLLRNVAKWLEGTNASIDYIVVKQDVDGYSAYVLHGSTVVGGYKEAWEVAEVTEITIADFSDEELLIELLSRRIESDDELDEDTEEDFDSDKDSIIDPRNPYCGPECKICNSYKSNV